MGEQATGFSIASGVEGGTGMGHHLGEDGLLVQRRPASVAWRPRQLQPFELALTELVAER